MDHGGPALQQNFMVEKGFSKKFKVSWAKIVSCDQMNPFEMLCFHRIHGYLKPAVVLQ